MFMVPGDDFFYKTEWQTTLYYINILPQWYKFYTFNWIWLENVIRDYSFYKNATLVVYTGHSNQVELGMEETRSPIYLVREKEIRGYPIPLTMWKVIIDLNTLEGIAIVGLNDPFITQPREYSICEDISGSLPGFVESRLTSPLYMYACDIQDLNSMNPFLPDFLANGTLNLFLDSDKYFTPPWNTILTMT